MINLLTLSDAYVHQINPFLIYPIRWYGLSYLAGLLAGWLIIYHICRVGKSTLQPKSALDLIVTIAFGMMIGGRLGYCIFYKPSLFATFTDQFPFWGVLAINEGGMASHGGIIGILIAAWIYARKTKQPYLYMLDLLGAVAPLGIFFGRIANFINGELYGRVVSNPNFPLGVKFPQEIPYWSDAKYTQLIQKLPPPTDFHIPTEYWTPNLIIDQVQKHNQIVIDTIAPMLATRHPSQIYQALLEGLSLFLILMMLYARPRKPGVITFAFFTGYGFFRILAEFWRLHDEGIEQVLGLNRGQWLSFPVIIVGIIGLIWVSRRKVDPLGGWLPVPKSETQSKTS